MDSIKLRSMPGVSERARAIEIPPLKPPHVIIKNVFLGNSYLNLKIEEGSTREVTVAEKKIFLAASATVNTNS